MSAVNLDPATAGLHLALSLSAGQLAALRRPDQTGAAFEIHIPRYGVRALINALDRHYPGVIDRARNSTAETTEPERTTL